VEPKVGEVDPPFVTGDPACAQTSALLSAEALPTDRGGEQGGRPPQRAQERAQVRHLSAVPVETLVSASRCLCRRLTARSGQRSIKGSPCRNRTRRRQWSVADRVRDAVRVLLGRYTRPPFLVGVPIRHGDRGVRRLDGSAVAGSPWAH
jgi:hypothetical protein